MTSNDPIPNNDVPPDSDSALVAPTGHEAPDVSTGAPTAPTAEGPVPTPTPEVPIQKTKRRRATPGSTPSAPVSAHPAAPAPAPNTQLADALDVFGGSGASPSVSFGRLTVFAIDANEKLFVPITTRLATTATHYLDGATFRGYARCSGTGCVVCRLGKRSDTRHLLPVYDPVARRVAVLPIPPAMRPGSLAPLLRPVLQRVQGGEIFLVGLSRRPDYTYTVVTYPLPADAELDAEAVATFAGELEAGRIDLTSVYPTMTAGDVASIPELAAEARLRGVAL